MGKVANRGGLHKAKWEMILARAKMCYIFYM